MSPRLGDRTEEEEEEEEEETDGEKASTPISTPGPTLCLPGAEDGRTAELLPEPGERVQKGEQEPPREDEVAPGVEHIDDGWHHSFIPSFFLSFVDL